MASFFQEFKNFAIKGNMIDMAVGIVIGTAFNNVISTIVKKIVMPPLSMLTDGVTWPIKSIFCVLQVRHLRKLQLVMGSLWKC